MAHYSFCDRFGLWEGCGNTLLAMAIMLPIIYHPVRHQVPEEKQNLHLMDVTSSTRPEVVQHGQQKWADVVMRYY